MRSTRKRTRRSFLQSPHDEHPEIGVVDGPRDRDGLTLTAREALGRGVHVGQAHPDALEQDPFGLGPHAPVVQQSHSGDPRGQFVSQEHVRRRVQVIGQGEGLIDRVDPSGDGVRMAVHLQRPAVHLHGSAGRLVDAGQDLDQGRFPGAVVSDDGQHLTGVRIQIDVGESGNPAEALVDPAHRHDWPGVGHCNSRSDFRHCLSLRGYLDTGAALPVSGGRQLP